MRTLVSLLIVAVCFLSACDTSLPTDVSYPIDLDRGIDLPYMVSDGHFVNNWYEGATNPSCLIFRDYECFDRYFSVGWYIGLDEAKLITEERMEGRFVLSIIYQGCDVVRLGIEKVLLHKGKLIVCYAREVTLSDVPFTGNYHLTLLIDDCRFDSVELYENGKRVVNVSITEPECD